jgi:hypothetical protein
VYSYEDIAGVAVAWMSKVDLVIEFGWKAFPQSLCACSPYDDRWKDAE